MKKVNLILFILIGYVLSACSTINHPQEDFSYFHHTASFDIAKVSHYNIAILGIIDETNSLTATEKEQFTYSVYQSFVTEVEEDNLITTEELVADISIEKYQQIVAAAKVNDINQISQVMTGADNQTSRYLLVVKLTDSRDLYKGSYSDDSFFSTNSCSTSGWAVGVTMTIIDTRTATEVWGGHLDKQDKQQYCNDDGEFINDRKHHRRNHHNDKELLAALLIVYAVIIIAEEMTKEQENEEEASSTLTNNTQLSIFKETVQDFSEQLPSFFR
ncbi:MAG: hypothetical protein HRT38_15225 [Alteromonadaceae bacterium]|nr:hypothetical protein [Alteromonadaceae bacterium]